MLALLISDVKFVYLYSPFIRMMSSPWALANNGKVSNNPALAHNITVPLCAIDGV